MLSRLMLKSLRRPLTVKCISLQYRPETTTLAITGDKVHEVKIETTVQVNPYLCSPSSKEKIYPTWNDNYDEIPIIIDGKEYTAMSDLLSYPKIPVLDLQLVDDAQACSEKDIHVNDILCVDFAQNMPTILDENKPERDKVNFPRPEMYFDHPEMRAWIFPASWFKPFYNKTGVTGPYVALTGFFTFLCSKEILVYTSEFHSGLLTVLIIIFLLKKYGMEFYNKILASSIKERQGWEDWRLGSIKFLENYIQLNKECIESSNSRELFDAKRENIALQREAEYRKRLMVIYNEVKRKLDYQVSLAEAVKHFEQKHMVNWVIDNVYKAINEEKQNAYLNQCIVDLSALASKHKI